MGRLELKKAQRRKEFIWFCREMPVNFPRGILGIDRTGRSVLNENLTIAEVPEAIQVLEVVVAFWGVA